MSEFVKITAGVNLGDGLDIKNAQTYMNQLESIFKNLSDNGQALAGAMQKTTELITRDFYVSADQAANAMKAVEAVRRHNIHTDVNDNTVSPIYYSNTTEDVEMVSFRRKLEETNARKLQKMKAFIIRSGGRMEQDIQDGYYNFTLPRASYMSDTGKPTTLDRYVRAKITRSNKQVHEQVKLSSLSEDQDAYAKEYEAIQARINKMHMKETTRAYAVSETKPPKSGDTDYGEGEGEESSKKNSMGIFKVLGVFYAIKKLLQMIHDVAKEILDRAFISATKAYDATTKGLPLGLTASQYMNYQYAAAAKGLAPDAITNGIQSVNTKFGNITEYDKDALRKLAIVLGSEVEELVKAGIGGKNPEELLNMILKGFVDKTLRGENSVGQQVGTQKALTELTEYLRKIDPNWADIYSRMMLDVLSPNSSDNDRRNARAGVTQWANGALPNAGNINANQINNGVILKNDSNAISAEWGNVKDGIFLRMAATLDSILNWLRPVMRHFMTDEGKADDRAFTAKHNMEVADAYEGYQKYAASQKDAKIDEIAKATGIPRSEVADLVTNFQLVNSPFTKQAKLFKEKMQYQTPAVFDALTQAVYFSAQETEARLQGNKAAAEAGKDDPAYISGGFSFLTEQARGVAKSLFSYTPAGLRKDSPYSLYLDSLKTGYEDRGAMPVGQSKLIRQISEGAATQMQLIDATSDAIRGKAAPNEITEVKVTAQGNIMVVEAFKGEKLVGSTSREIVGDAPVGTFGVSSAVLRTLRMR